MLYLTCGTEQLKIVLPHTATVAVAVVADTASAVANVVDIMLSAVVGTSATVQTVLLLLLVQVQVGCWCVCLAGVIVDGITVFG